LLEKEVDIMLYQKKENEEESVEKAEERDSQMSEDYYNKLIEQYTEAYLTGFSEVIKHEIETEKDMYLDYLSVNNLNEDLLEAIKRVQGRARIFGKSSQVRYSLYASIYFLNYTFIFV